MLNLFKKNKDNPKRDIRNLLRENLNCIEVDFFSSSDPLIQLTSEERKLYLKKFKDISDDKEIIGRIKYLINLQSKMILRSAKDGSDMDMAGAMTINGLSVVLEDIERLSTMFEKENIGPEKFDRFGIV